MHAFLIKPIGLLGPWTDTGIRTTVTPEREKARLKREHPGHQVIAVRESEVERMVSRG